MCWLTLCSCPPVQSVCLWGSSVDRDEKDREREDKEEKERKSVLGERRKRKAATPKAQTHKSKNNSFLPFLLFSLTSPLFSLFLASKKTKHPKDKQHTNDRQERREGTECG